MMINIGRIRSYLLIPSIKCWMSYEKYGRDIFESQFHKKGAKHFKKSRTMQRYISTNVVEIDKTLLSL